MTKAGAPPPGDELVVTYRLSVTDPASAEELAEAIAREQSVEVPPDVGGEELQRRMLGRVEAVSEVGTGSTYDARIRYPLALTGTDLLPLLNVAYGNVSLMDGVRVVELDLPEAALDTRAGPAFGADGIRARTGVASGAALVSTAIKPVGLGTAALAELAGAFARAGVNIVKDDHGIVDQGVAPFSERVRAVSAAVAESNARSGGRCSYFPNVTGPLDGLAERLDLAEQAGCGGVVLCPSLMGLDTMRHVARRSSNLAVMAHPSHGQASPGRRSGMSPEVLFGTVYRAFGADIVVYVNAGGRFAWPVETCEAINARLRAPWRSVRPALPAPAGGVRTSDARMWLERYGPDTVLLIGGSVLRQADVEAAAAALVAEAAAVAATPSAGRSSP